MRIRPTTAAYSAALALCLSGCADDRVPYKGVPTFPAIRGVLEHSVLLVGDTGDDDSTDPSKRHAVLRSLEKIADTQPDRTTTVFLGDLIYQHGYPAAGGEELPKARQRLENQLEAAGDGAGVFVPGNHDWANGHEEGWDNVRALAGAVSEFAGRERRSRMVLPADGCPGPAVYPLGPRATLIAIDTHWWLHAFAKPSPDQPAGCDNVTEEAILAALRARIREAHDAGKLPIVAGHHPLRSHGAHGGFFDWRAHVFPITMTARWAWLPLPGIGTIVTTWRAQRSWMNQDMSHPDYARMISVLEAALDEAAMLHPVVYAAGHDHGMQVLRAPASGVLHLVSGLGSPDQVMHVSHAGDTLFSFARGGATGFMRIDFLANELPQLSIYEAGEASDSLLGRMPIPEFDTD